jgi:hypothetical protein
VKVGNDSYFNTNDKQYLLLVQFNQLPLLPIV